MLDLFGAVVFSSDTRSVKPSPRLFEAALATLGVPHQTPSGRVVVVGDSLAADVAPARALGLASIWINPAGAPVPPGAPVPDHSVPDLLALAPADA